MQAHSFWGKAFRTVACMQVSKGYEKFIAPHHHNRTESRPGTLQRSAHVFCTASGAGKSAVCPLSPPTNSHPTSSGSLCHRLHRWDHRDGICDCPDHPDPHPAAKKLVDGAALTAVATVIARGLRCDEAIPAGIAWQLTYGASVSRTTYNNRVVIGLFRADTSRTAVRTDSFLKRLSSQISKSLANLRILRKAP